MKAQRIIKEIDALKGKIVNLEGELVLATTENAKVAIRNQLTATQNSITELYKLLPPPGKNSFPVFEILTQISLPNQLCMPFFLHFFFPAENQLLIMLKIDFIFSTSFQKFLLSSSISCFLCLKQSGPATCRW
jgi:hypothetical protein